MVLIASEVIDQLRGNGIVGFCNRIVYDRLKLLYCRTRVYSRTRELNMQNATGAPSRSLQLCRATVILTIVSPSYSVAICMQHALINDFHGGVLALILH